MGESISERVAQTMERIRAACARSGRAADSVRLLAVTKKQPPERVREALAAGVTVFGENRVQEAKVKISMCPGHAVWHMIGHLQTNKARDAARLFQMIHSVDSLRLLEAIDEAASAAGRVMPVLLEVNVSGESSKFGLAPEAVPAVLDEANRLRRVQVAGLMTIPPPADDPEKARPHFAKLRTLRDEWRRGTGHGLDELSMGMSGDFEVAIEEGATWVRLGMALFGPRSAA